MRLRLRVLNAPEGEQTFTIDPPGGMVGRSADSAVCLPYDSVSRQHAELQFDGHRWWLHQRSQNSLTLLDDQPLQVGTPPGQLSPRGSLKLGRVALQYWQEGAVAVAPTLESLAHQDGEATMILPRRIAPMSIPTAMLAQMSPVRVAESAPLAAPPTMIRRASTAVPPPPPREALSAKSETPMTLIIRPRAGAAQPSAATQTQPAAVAQPQPVVEHQTPIPRPTKPEIPPAPDPALAVLRGERDRLTAEVARLKRENEELRDTRAALMAQVAANSEAVAPPVPAPAPSAETPRANLAALSEKALELLQPFGRSLEQAGEALRQNDTAQARGLLRTASFALADLRDLFQP